MAEYEMKDMTGSLFKNENPKSDRSPPMNGRVKIDGKMYWMSGFNNESKAGKKYIGLTFSPMDDSGQSSSPPRRTNDDDGWGL